MPHTPQNSAAYFLPSSTFMHKKTILRRKKEVCTISAYVVTTNSPFEGLHVFGNPRSSETAFAALGRQSAVRREVLPAGEGFRTPDAWIWLRDGVSPARGRFGLRFASISGPGQPLGAGLRGSEIDPVGQEIAQNRGNFQAPEGI